MRISDWSSDVCSSDLLYATVRNIAANDRMVRAGDWARGVKPALSGRVTGRRIGILGLCRIGRAIARRLELVAGEIFYHNRRPAADGARPKKSCVGKGGVVTCTAPWSPYHYKKK